MRIGTWIVLSWLAISTLGCGGGTPAAADPVHAPAEIASLSYSVDVKPGEGTMTQPTADALRQALEEAGFHLGGDADVVFELTVRDVEAPQFFKVVMNGVEQRKRSVTATLRAVSGDKVLDEKTSMFVSTESQPVDPKQLRPLLKHFAESKKLEEVALELAIDRSRKKLKEMPGGDKPGGDEGDAPKPAPEE